MPILWGILSANDERTCRAGRIDPTTTNDCARRRVEAKTKAPVSGRKTKGKKQKPTEGDNPEEGKSGSHDH
ncbi:30s ribosomal protein s15 [Moniliophthora roreri]|nr:30s ribosomal protein s15 [Moniliophthora roreri]